MFFIFLWWLPVWLLSPAISDILGFGDDPTAKHNVFLVLIIVQTIFGLLGLVIASREVVTAFKSVPRKKVPGKVWQVFRTGNYD